MKITELEGKTRLNNGVEMPYLGLGVYQINDHNEVVNAVLHALEIGYRLIDTASIYGNEKSVGEAIKTSALLRDEVFITSKLWTTDMGYDNTFNALKNTLKRLQTEYVDLYLIHWPVDQEYIDSWWAMEDLYRQGLARAIGVSNFTQHHLETIMDNSKIKPMVNQVEFHPYLRQQPLLDFCQKENIQLQSWSPLMKGKVTEIAEIKKIAEKYNKTPVQVVLRWNLQKGIATIPKSSKKERITSNAHVFDFELTEEDMATIDGLDRNHRIGPDPENFDF